MQDANFPCRALPAFLSLYNTLTALAEALPAFLSYCGTPCGYMTSASFNEHLRDANWICSTSISLHEPLQGTNCICRTSCLQKLPPTFTSQCRMETGLTKPLSALRSDITAPIKYQNSRASVESKLPKPQPAFMCSCRTQTAQNSTCFDEHLWDANHACRSSMTLKRAPLILHRFVRHKYLREDHSLAQTVV